MNSKICGVLFLVLLSVVGTLHASPLASNDNIDLTLESLAQAVDELNLNQHALEQFTLSKLAANLTAQATLIGKLREDGTAYMMKYNEGGAVQQPQCMNVTAGLLDSTPIDVHTFTSCVKLYEQTDCTGANLITDDDGSYNDLKSIGPC